MSPPSRSSLQTVAHLAEVARQAMLRDRASGEVQFSRLLARYPEDGMVYYERGVAYRELGLYALALADFERAVPLLLLRESKQRALDAAEVLRQRLDGGLGGALTNARQRLDRLQRLDLLLTISLLEALEQVDVDPAHAAVLLRDCLDRFLRQAMPSGKSDHDDWRARLQRLGARAPQAVMQHAQLVYVLGNLGTHPRPDQPLTMADAYGSLNGLLSILEWWEGH
ncbi:MAG: DUF4145 domain-containing protein [Anaerolineales bacterium]